MQQIAYNGHILNEQTINHEPVGHLDELPEWNRTIAKAQAQEEGLELSEEHWEVLRFLRRRYANQGQSRYGRLLQRELASCFAGRGGNKRLYQLFPGGPVTQGCRIAGLPPPDFHQDNSFGSVR